MGSLYLPTGKIKVEQLDDDLFFVWAEDVWKHAARYIDMTGMDYPKDHIGSKAPF